MLDVELFGRRSIILISHWILSRITLKRIRIFKKCWSVCQIMTGKPINKESLVVVHHEVWVCLFLVLATLCVYWQVNHYDFINLNPA